MGRKKKEIRLREPVRIREKKITGDNISLYLDIHQKGLRKKETLKLYLMLEINAATKLQNTNTRKLAEQVKAQRILDIQREGLVDWDEVKKSRMTLTKWMDDFVKYNAKLPGSSTKTKRNIHAHINQYLLHIGKPEFLLKDVGKEFCKGSIAFLKTCTYNDGKKQLNTTTCRTFVNYFGSSLAKTARDELIEQNPFLLLEAKEKPQKRVIEHEFLTIEEIKKVMNTPCRYELVKKAFLFSCFTDPRYSDMKALNWSETHKAADGKTEYTDHIQVETKDRVTIPLSEETKRWMSKREEGVDNIFRNLAITSTTVEVVPKEWMEAARIARHIAYHCSRHTATTMLLTLGASIYAVSKIPGHKSIKMTGIYARIVDKKKLETMNLVNGMFGQIPVTQ